MSRMGKVESDLLYVRSALERSEATGAPAAIYFLWAAVSLVGFALLDVRPQVAGWYWSVAGPLGGVLSFVLGWRWGRRMGQGSLRIARYHALHWLGLTVAIFLAVPLKVAGVIEGDALGRVILLIIAIGYYTAGIYLVRGFLWIGLAITAGYVALFFFEGFTWTAVGALFALSLSLGGILGARRGPRSEG